MTDDPNSQQPVGSWPEDSELLIGLVGPIGVDLVSVQNTLRRELMLVGYTTEPVRLSDLLQTLPGFEEVVPPGASEDVRLHKLMTGGNTLRQQVERPDAMASLAVMGVSAARENLESLDPPAERRAYVIRQLKRPEEIETLRRIYGENFVVIGASSPPDVRERRLADMIGDTETTATAAQRAKAIELAARDEQEDAVPMGQRLRDTYWLSDLFVDPSNPAEMDAAIQRFVDLLFARKLHTPTKDEFAMFEAWGAAMRSGSLARQVGAVLVDERGAVIAAGTNDVPRSGGGLYWEGDQPDGRDHVLGRDESDRMRRNMIIELLTAMRGANWLHPNLADDDLKDLAAEALHGAEPFLKKTRANALVEFVRAVHAEEAALAEASRRGAATSGASLVVTTFPCHHCARMIVASGVCRVCFIEPYHKSLALDFYPDSLSLTGESLKVQLVPFVGVAPRTYIRLFERGAIRWKDDEGRVIQRHGAECQLRLTYNGSRPNLEAAEEQAIAPLNALYNTAPTDDAGAPPSDLSAP